MPTLPSFSLEEIAALNPPPKALPSFSLDEIAAANKPYVPTPADTMNERLHNTIASNRELRKNIEDSRSGVKGFVAGNADWLTERMPGIGSGFALMDAGKAYEAANRLHDNTYSQQDLNTVANFYLDNERKAKDWDESSIAGKAWSVVSRLPGIAIEFASTGGAAGVVKGSVKSLLLRSADKVATTAARKAVEGVTRKSLVRGVASKVGDMASTAALQTAINVPQFAAGTLQNMGPQFDEQGRLVQGDSLARGATRAFTDQFIENLTERMGGEAFNKAVGASARLVLGPQRAAAAAAAASRLTGADRLAAVRTRVAKYMADKYGLAIPEAAKQLADKVAFNGMLGEYLEERYGEGMRHAANALGLDLINQKDSVVGNVAGGVASLSEGDRAAALQQFGAALEQTAVEGLAFSMPGAAAMAYGAAQKAFSPSEVKPADRADLGEPTSLVAPVAPPEMQPAPQPTPQGSPSESPAGSAPSMPQPAAPPKPSVPVWALRTPKGAAEFAQANPEAAAAIIANPSRSNIANLTGTDREQWGSRKDRNRLVAELTKLLTTSEQPSPTAPLPPNVQAPPPPAPVAEPLPAPTATPEQPRLPDVVPAGDNALAQFAAATDGERAAAIQAIRNINDGGASLYSPEQVARLQALHDAAMNAVQAETGTSTPPSIGQVIRRLQAVAPAGMPPSVETPAKKKKVFVKHADAAKRLGITEADLTALRESRQIFGVRYDGDWAYDEADIDRAAPASTDTAEVAEVVKQANALPPVKPGFVRLYHGGSGYGLEGKRWLTPDPIYAQGYADKSGGIVQYVDIPESDPRLMKSFDDEGTGQKAPYMAFEADEETSKRLRPLVDQTSKPALPPKQQETPPPAPERSDFDKMRDDLSKYLGVPVEPAEHDEAYQPAIDAAKKLGLEVQLVRMENDHLGFSRNDKILINTARVKGEEAIWYIAGHEIAHGTGVDRALNLTDEELRHYGDRYLAGIPADSPYRRALQADPERLKREAAAVMVGQFMTDEGFRNEVFAADKPLWIRIADAVIKLFSSRKLSKNARAAVNALKEARKRATMNEAPAAPEVSDDGQRSGRSDGAAAPAVGEPVLGLGASGPGGESPAAAPATPEVGNAGTVSDQAGGQGVRGERAPAKQPRPGRRGKDAASGPSDRDGSQPERPAVEGTPVGDEGVVEAFQSDAGSETEPADGSTQRALNHRIGPADVLLVAGPGAKKTRALANIAAIKLLKQLEAENRDATPEEKKILAQYVGWGGLKGYFARILGGALEGKHPAYLRNEAWEKKYGSLYKEIRQLLTKEEWDAAASSTQNAHYTDRRVIERMWEIAERIGFSGGKVWEPAAGVGHFFGLMPEQFVGKTKLIASEKDSLSARITAKLYPRAKVMESALEDLSFPNNTVDLAISNVPFSAFQPGDSKKRYGLSLNLHNYFLARMIDAVRPGGLVVAISTFRTMDAQTEMRKFLAGRANLIGAIRLPNTAFKENADTEIPTDIIVLQKPLDTVAAPTEPFNSLTPVMTPDGVAQVNEYFARHPEMVLGEHSLQGTMYGGRKAKTDAADEAVDNQRDAESKPDAETAKEFEGGEYTVMPKKGVPLDAQLKEAIDRLPENVMERGEAEAFNFSSLGEATGLRENSIQLVNGQIAVVKDGRYANPHDHGLLTAATELKRAKEYVELRDHYKQHLRAMLSPDSTDQQVEASRVILEQMYDRYYKRNGMLHGSSTKPFAFDPDFYLVRGMEKVRERMEADKKTGKLKQKQYATKADVLSKRTLFPTTLPNTAGSVSEAVRLSSFYKGTLDIGYVADLLGKSIPEAEAELAKSGEAYKDPDSGLWTPKAMYLSGNVRQKLAAAKIAAKENKEFEANVAALEAVQPAPKSMKQIRASIASTWIPPHVHEQFLREKLSAASGIVVQYNTAGDRWDLAGQKYLTSEAANSTYGTERVTALSIYEQTLNMKSPSVYDSIELPDGGKSTRFNAKETQLARSKQTSLQDAFAAWLKGKTDLHPELEEIFNERYNSNVLPEFDSSDLPLPGASTSIKLRQHQMRAVRRFIGDGQGLMAHAVGAGKTYAQIAIAMESKRLGLAKKPLIVVQNATLTQFAASFHEMYPAANVLVATKNDLEASKRQAFLAQMTANDYDAVIMPQSSFDLLPVSEERQVAYINEMIEELERAVAEEQANNAKSGKKKGRGKSDIESQLDKLRDRLKTLTDKIAARAEKLLTFEDLGIDLLFIDEAHAYKKPPFTTKLERIVGLNKSTSQRAFQMLLKARAVQDKRNGKGVLLATGTPITNTMGEAYHMLNICAPNVLKEYGVEKFDQFASTFFQVKQVLTTNAAGRFASKTALHGWMNQAAFRRMLRSAWDIITTTQLHDIFKNDPDVSKRVDLPKLEGGKTTIAAVPITKAVKGIKKFLGDVYDTFLTLSGDEKKEASWVPLVTYGLSKAAALDIRLVNPQAADDPGSKVNECVKRAIDIYNDERYAEHKGTQLIFCDSFNRVKTDKLMAFVAGKEIGYDVDEREEVETDDGVRLQSEGEKGSGEAIDDSKTPFLYADLRKKLVAGGIPIEKIAVITEHDTDAKRAALFEKVKNGDVRILIGSTPKMGVGVNVQDRLSALHHLDAPWLPSDLEQRNGRIMRQGNLFAKLDIPVQLISYGMIDTLDAGLYSSILRKAQNIEGALSSRSEDDLEGDDDPFSGNVPTYQEQMAILSGDPRVMEKLELTEKIKSWDMEREAFLDAKAVQQRALETMQDRHDELTGPRIKKQQAIVEGLKEGDRTAETITATVDGKTHKSAADIGEAIDKAIKAKVAEVIAKTKSGDVQQLDESGAKKALNAPGGAKNLPQNIVATFEIGKAKVDVVAYAAARAKQGEDGKGIVKEWTTGIAARMEYQGLNLYAGNAQTGRGLVDGYLALADRAQENLSKMEAEAARLAEEIPKYEALLHESFSKSEELANARARIKEIDEQLAAEGAAGDEAAKQRGSKNAAERAQEAADEDTGTEEGFAAGAVANVRVKHRSDFVPEIAKVSDPEVERRMSAAHGVAASSKLEKAKSVVDSFVRKATRAQEFLPNNGEWGYENEWFRLLKTVPATQQDETIRTVAAIVDPLGPKQKQLFQRLLITDNMIAAYDRGEPLRFGFKSREQLLEYRDQLSEAIEQVPAIKTALERRSAVVRELVEDLVKHELLGEEALENVGAYYHQQVLAKYVAERDRHEGSKVNPVRRSFQKARVKGEELGEEHDYNTDYIQAEIAWMTEARIELEKAKRLAALEKKRDIKPQLRQEARERNFEALVGGPENVRRIETLRRLIKESRESDDSDAKAARSDMIDELTELDPTYPYRKKIAKFVSRIRRAWKEKKFPAPGFTRVLDVKLGMEDATDVDDLGPEWFRFLAWAAAERGDEVEGLSARGIFKAIQDRKQMIKDKLGDDYVEWSDIVPSTHLKWQPEPGNYFYQALALPEKIAEQFQRGILDKVELNADELRQVLVMGGPKKELVFKKELVEQLKSLEKPKPVEKLLQVFDYAQRLWKGSVLYKASNYIAYSVRNILSDAEVTAAAPGIWRHFNRKMLGELMDYYHVKTAVGIPDATKLTLSPELRAARDHGVLNASFEANELPNVNTLDVFVRHYADNAPLFKKILESLKRTHVAFQSFREASTRYAAFLYFREALEKNDFANFGGSNPAVVRAIKKEMGIDAAAAHLSRNLIGDYGNLTVMGKALRRFVFPFWSWTEINLKRYYRLLLNAGVEGKSKGGSSAVRRAVYAAGALLRLGAFAGTVWAWNMMAYPHLENKLSDRDRARPHIITGENADGTINLIRNMSAAGDVLEWTGIPTLVSLADDVQSGQMTWGEALQEAAKDPLNKLFQGFGPHIKAPLEIASEKSYFPDVLNPRPITREEAVAQNLGMPDEYYGLKGAVTGNGDRTKPHFAQRVFTPQSIVDPRENALHEIIGLRNRFLEREGKAFGAPDHNMQNMRRAAAQHDYERFAEARAAYLASGKKSWGNFEDSLRKIDPFGSMKAEDERRFVAEYLTPVQRQRLDIARQYARDMELEMRAMWKRAVAEEDKPGAEQEHQAAINASLMNAADTLAEAPPLKIAKRQDWKDRGEAAFRRIDIDGQSVPQLRMQYNRYLAAEIKDPTARAAKLNRFTQRLLQMKRGS